MPRKHLIGLTIAGIVVFFVIAFFSSIVNLIVDWLWFDEVGFTQIFTTILKAKVFLGFVFGLVVFILTYLNLRLASFVTRSQPEIKFSEMPQLDLKKYFNWLILVFCLVVGVLAGLYGVEAWEVFLKKIFKTAVVLEKGSDKVNQFAKGHLLVLISLLFILQGLQIYFVRIPELLYSQTGSFLGANYTDITNATPHISGIAINDSVGLTWGWNVTCYNGTSHFNTTTSLAFGVDGNPPEVTIDDPDDNTYTTDLNTTLFKYTVVDTSNPEYSLVYTNFSGTWQVNHTNSSYTSNVQIAIDLMHANHTNTTLPDGRYIWGVTANDSAGNKDTSGNRTVIIDTIFPTAVTISAPGNNTFSNDATPEFTWTATTEANFDKYRISMSENLNRSDPFQTREITTKSVVAVNLTIGDDGTYYVDVVTFDLAGHAVNTTVLYYTLDRVTINATLNTPLNNSFLADNTPDFNVTVIDENPATCTLLLSDVGSDTLIKNDSVISITNGTRFNITPTAMADGIHKFNVECNDSRGVRVNVSDTVLQTTVDTIAPTASVIISEFHQTNSTSRIPTLKWNVSVDLNFSRYLVESLYVSNDSVAYEVNVTTKTTLQAQLALFSGSSYTFNVTVFDLAGNTNSAGNTTLELLYYTDTVCADLVTGWNACGAVWETGRTLTRIGNETSAEMVSVWNSTHQWATCNLAASTSGQHCNVLVNINSSLAPKFNFSNDNITDNGEFDYSVNHAVWIYVDQSTHWPNRTWEANQFSANITLTNFTNIGWNLEGMFVRSGRVFGHIEDRFGDNVSMFSLRHNNGTSVPFVNNGLFKSINNGTQVDFGKAIWYFYNGTDQITAAGANASTSNKPYDVGVW